MVGNIIGGPAQANLLSRSHVLPRGAVPPDLRGQFDTVIGDVPTTGNSGSGVFDALNQCLLGIMRRKFSVVKHGAKTGTPAHTIVIAKYFVPVGNIKAFVPNSISFQFLAKKLKFIAERCVDWSLAFQ